MKEKTKKHCAVLEFNECVQKAKSQKSINTRRFTYFYNHVIDDRN